MKLKHDYALIRFEIFITLKCCLALRLFRCYPAQVFSSIATFRDIISESLDGDWCSGTVRSPNGLLMYKDVTTRWEKDPKQKETDKLEYIMARPSAISSDVSPLLFYACP
jgi:hypothetical protein